MPQAPGVRAAGAPALQGAPAAAAAPAAAREPEDVALGFWLSEPVLRATADAPRNVTYVRINDRCSNVGCTAAHGLYQRPQNDSVAIHYLKGASSMKYVWSLLGEGAQHGVGECYRAVWGKR